MENDFFDLLAEDKGAAFLAAGRLALLLSGVGTGTFLTRGSRLLRILRL
jgi:hypothetical protein